MPGHIVNSHLAESTILLKNKHWLWRRAELTGKDSLLLFTRIQTYTAGYS